MELNKKTLRSAALAAFSVLAAYWCLQNLTLLLAALRWLARLLAPFALGGAIAFLLNVPMRAIERNLFPAAKKGTRFRRPLAYLLTLAVVLGVLVLAAFVVGPRLTEALSSLARQAPAAFRSLQEWFAALEERYPELKALVMGWNIDWSKVSGDLLGLFQGLADSLLSSGAGFVGGVVSGVSTFVIGFVFSVYILLQKEKLARQGRQCVYALLPEERADRVLEVLRLAERTFASFLSGQCVEAVILGSMFFVSMTLLRMPYALLVGVLIALTALVPIVGAFIGCAVGALLIAISAPLQAAAFLLLFFVLQQIEGNLIYPHVVGSSVGLPSIWVLAAVTVGGKLMGIWGMLFFIPLCSVLYALFRSFIYGRLRRRQVPEEKWRMPVPAPAAEKAAGPGTRKSGTP